MRARARREEDKQERREAILEAAQRIWAQASFDAFTMAEVARCVRLAKGTLYLYFPTKEALLLDVLEVRLDRCLTALEARLEEGVCRDPDVAAGIVVSALAADDPLVRLLMIMGTILEQNVPEERIYRFKTWLLSRLARTGRDLEQRLTSVPPGGGVRLLLHLHVLVAGLGQIARPAPAVARVLERPELEPLCIDFETELGAMVTALVRGQALEASSTGSTKGRALTERRRRRP